MSSASNNSNASATAVSSNLSAAAALSEAMQGMVQMQSVHYLGDKIGLTVIFSFCLTAATVLGAIGNVMIILSVLIDKFLRQPGNVFIINLALADFLISIILDPFNIVGAVYGGAFFANHHWICMIVGVLCTPICVVSLYNITAVAVNRYVRICKLKYYKKLFTWKSGIAMCVATWIAGFLVHFPNDVGWGQTGYNADYYFCGFLVTHTYSYSLFWVGFSVVAPLIVTVYCYVKIFDKFKSSRSALESHTTTNVTRGSPDGNPVIVVVPAKSTKDDDERRLLRSLLLVLVAFVVCWGPFVILVAVGTPRLIPGWLYVISIIMAHSNSAVNVFIYGLTNRHFRACYRRLLFYVLGKVVKPNDTSNRVFSLNHQLQQTTNNGRHTSVHRVEISRSRHAAQGVMSVKGATTSAAL